MALSWDYDGHFSCAKVGRYEIIVWPFGDIYQVVVVLDEETDARVGLQPARTIEDAKQQGLDWIEQFEQNGPKGPEEVIAEAAKYYELSRESSLLHMFCTPGCGFSWFEGALLEFNQEPKPEALIRENERLRKLEQKIKDAKEEVRKLLGDKGLRFRVVVSDSEPPRQFSILSNSCNLLKIPANIKPEWASVARETAQLLCDKGNKVSDRETGSRILNQLGPASPIG